MVEVRSIMVNLLLAQGGAIEIVGRAFKCFCAEWSYDCAITSDGLVMIGVCADGIILPRALSPTPNEPKLNIYTKTKHTH
jgi:hypothetical protein